MRNNNLNVLTSWSFSEDWQPETFFVTSSIHNGTDVHNNMEICKAPTMRLKALNKHNMTHIMYLENVISNLTKANT